MRTSEGVVSVSCVHCGWRSRGIRVSRRFFRVTLAWLHLRYALHHPEGCPLEPRKAGR